MANWQNTDPALLTKITGTLSTNASHQPAAPEPKTHQGAPESSTGKKASTPKQNPTNAYKCYIGLEEAGTMQMFFHFAKCLEQV